MSDEEREEWIEDVNPNSEDLHTNVADSYRDGERNKVSDFFKGLLLSIGLIILYYPLTWIGMMLPYVWVIVSLTIIIITYIGIFIALRRSIIKKNRRYIAIGMIIPFLLSIIFLVIMLIGSIFSSFRFEFDPEIWST